jgi:hypothetical protein
MGKSKELNRYEMGKSLLLIWWEQTDLWSFDKLFLIGSQKGILNS